MNYETTEQTQDDPIAKPKKESDKDIHARALKEFKMCQEADDHNRIAALDDLRFARLGEQWPQEIIDKRQLESRPCMTFNRMPTFIRQVVNDGRQNKPAIKVHPADDSSDPATALVINDLIRNIEYGSNAEVAYDTGLDFSASCGMGYWRVGMEYSHDDTFDMDLEIQPISNVFSVYGDYASTAADSSDWNICFVTDAISKDSFEAKYGDKEKIDWEGDAYREMPDNWREGENIIVAEYWCRKEVPKTIVLMSDGRVVSEDWLGEEVDGLEDIEGMTNEKMLVTFGVTRQKERQTRGYEVTQYIMSGVEILKTNKWAGQYIPIVPIYGEVVNVEGKRYYRSLIRDAKDAQRNFNYWRTTSTELVALAPKAPFIGPVGSFVTDGDKWASANTQSHPFIEYDPVTDDTGTPQPGPQRQPFAGVPAGALQEALNASDDMKATIGMFDASLGARSNETSGTAINARKTEGDTGTFHLIDNQSRAIRHTGRILIDLIPHVYSKARVIRVMGEDKAPRNVQIGPQQPGQQPMPPQAQQAQPAPNPQDEAIDRIYDLTIGKYDLTVDTGPGFQTKRQEAAYGMTELMRAVPAAAPLIAPHLAKQQDWPGAEELAAEMAALAPKPQQGPDPQIQQHIEQMQQQLQQQGQQLESQDKQLKDKGTEHELDAAKVKIDAYKAETDRLKVITPAFGPDQIHAVVMQTLEQVMTTQIPGAQSGAMPLPNDTQQMPAPAPAFPPGGQSQEQQPAPQPSAPPEGMQQ